VSEEKAASPVRVWRWSYLTIPIVLIAAGVMDLGGMLLAILFSLFALARLRALLGGRKWAAVGLFVAVAAALSYGAGYFARATARDLPDIVDKSAPAIVDWAKQHQINIPFTDYDSLKERIVTTARTEASYVGDAARLARGAAERILLVLVGIIVAIGIFLNLQPRIEPGARIDPLTNLSELAGTELRRRFAAFYGSFELIMGAQITIAAINTLLTAIFVLVVGLPHAVVIIGVTFLCEMLPVVGNLVSNTIIVCIAFTVSPRDALIALIFLVAIHKLEYFLNSKIVGHRIHLPIWMILLALIVGEKLMGITGMVLAPVALHYVRTEAAAIPVA
jgi:predicted PurR-regulated permease PerM